MDIAAAEAWRQSLEKGADRTDRETAQKYAANQETTRILGEQLAEKAKIDAFLSSQGEVETAEMRERWTKRERAERATDSQAIARGGAQGRGAGGPRGAGAPEL